MISDERLERRRVLRAAFAAARREAARTLERFDGDRVQAALDGLDGLIGRLEDCRALASPAGGANSGPNSDETAAAIEALRNLGRAFQGKDGEERDREARLVLPGAVIEAMDALGREIRPGARRDALYAVRRRARVVLRPRNLIAAAILGAAILVALNIHETRQREARLQAISTFSLDLMNPVAREGFTLGGLLPPEHSDQGSWRWGLGPKTVAAFVLARKKEIVVTFAFNNLIPGQSVSIVGNGALLKAYEDLPAASWLEETVRGQVAFKGIEGVNVLEIKYGLWNHNGALIAEEDRNWYAIAFTGLSIVAR